jgi:hypothetical protein
MICPDCGRPQLTDLPHVHLAPTAPVRRIRTCSVCGALATVGDRCDDHDGPDAVGILVLGFVILIGCVVIALAGWYLSTPRSAPDPTAPTPSPAMAGLDRVAPGPVASASGPEPSGAPTIDAGSPGRPSSGQAGPGVGAPSPQAVIAPPLEVIRGTATHYCLSGQRGTAYCTRGYGPEDLVAAIDTDLGFAKGDVVIVRSLAGPESVRVTIVDVCGCPGERLIDLTSGAFRRLAPLGLGVIPVTLELAGADRTLPPTDVDP